MTQQLSNRERQMIAAEREIQSAERRGDTVTAELFRGVLARIVRPKTMAKVMTRKQRQFTLILTEAEADALDQLITNGYGDGEFEAYFRDSGGRIQVLRSAITKFYTAWGEAK